MMNNDMIKEYIGQRVDIETAEDLFDSCLVIDIKGDWLKYESDGELHCINLYHVIEIVPQYVLDEDLGVR